MSIYGLNLNEAKKLQKWALEVSVAKKFLDSIQKFPKTIKIKPGLYVNYEIDESELEDDGLDYCTPTVATIFAINNKGEKTSIATLSAYNWETYWLDANECEYHEAKDWWEDILKEYEKIMSNGGEEKDGRNKL